MRWLCAGWGEPGGQWTEWGWRNKEGSCGLVECRHSVFEEVHLTFSFDIQTVLEAMAAASCDRQTVPVVDHYRWEKKWRRQSQRQQSEDEDKESSFKEKDNWLDVHDEDKDKDLKIDPGGCSRTTILTLLWGSMMRSTWTWTWPGHNSKYKPPIRQSLTTRWRSTCYVSLLDQFYKILEDLNFRWRGQGFVVRRQGHGHKDLKIGPRGSLDKDFSARTTTLLTCGILLSFRQPHSVHPARHHSHHLRSYHLSLPRSFTNPFLHSDSFWTAFTDLDSGHQWSLAFVCFSFLFFYIFMAMCATKLVWLSFWVHVKFCYHIVSKEVR